MRRADSVRARNTSASARAHGLLPQIAMLSLSGLPNRPKSQEATLVLNGVRVISDAGAVLVLSIRSERHVIAKRHLLAGTSVRAEGDCGRIVLTERYASALGVA
jgi:hypothetical protein